LLDLPLAQVRRGDGAGDAAAVAGGVVGDHVRRADQPRRLHRDQLGVARPDAHAVQPSGRPPGHRSASPASSPATALTAAAVIALPPRRPRTVRWSRPLAASASLDSAAPMKPTGIPKTAAGRPAP